MTPPSRAMWEASPTPMFGVRDPSHSSFAAQASVGRATNWVLPWKRALAQTYGVIFGSLNVHFCRGQERNRNPL